MANVGGAEISGHATEFKLSLSLSFDSVILKYKQFPPLIPLYFLLYALIHCPAGAYCISSP